MPHSYEYWLAATEGKPLPELELGRVEWGFFRQQNRNGGFDAWALWPGEDDSIRALKNGEPVEVRREDEFAERVFSWICKHPITEDQYRAFRQTGRWHDEPPPKAEATAAPGSNMPVDPFEAMKLELEGEREEIERWLATNPIKDQGSCDRAANWRNRVRNEIRKKADDIRKREKEPHLNEARAVDQQWNPLIAESDRLEKLLISAMDPFLKTEAERRRQERAEAVAAGKKPTEPPKNARAGTLGARTALRTVYHGTVEDPAVFTAWLIENKHPDLLELLDKLAQRIASVKAEAPGIVVTQRQQAA
jgi:hypothetical protein